MPSLTPILSLTCIAAVSGVIFAHKHYGLANRAKGYNIFVTGEVGCGRTTVVRKTLAEFYRVHGSGWVAYVR